MKAVFLLCLVCGCILFSLHGKFTFERAGCKMVDVVLLILLSCMFEGEPADCVWFQSNVLGF
jgi:hypothetical protein